MQINHRKLLAVTVAANILGSQLLAVDCWDWFGHHKQQQQQQQQQRRRGRDALDNVDAGVAPLVLPHQGQIGQLQQPAHLPKREQTSGAAQTMLHCAGVL
jgi:hypothetical protein